MTLTARVVVFDLDDTLAVSKAPIEPRMVAGLLHLLERVDVCIISGGRYEQFQKQVLDRMPLHDKLLSRLHLMPTCGTRYLHWIDDEWTEIYAEYLTAEEKARITTVLTDSAKSLGLWETETWGEVIEDRGSQVTLSALGQQAPHAAKSAWDPDGSRRRALQALVSEGLPDLEVRSGGSTSIDVTRKGIDKAHGIRKLMEQLKVGIDDIVFIGDRLEPGGNDYPVKAMGVRCFEVRSWEETATFVEGLLASSSSIDGQEGIAVTL